MIHCTLRKRGLDKFHRYLLTNNKDLRENANYKNAYDFLTSIRLFFLIRYKLKKTLYLLETAFFC